MHLGADALSRDFVSVYVHPWNPGSSHHGDESLGVGIGEEE